MNNKQKKCLWAGIALIVVMGLFPPWVCERETKIAFGHGEWKSITEPGPYSWIGDPPGKINSQGYLYIRPKFVDLYRLGIQYFVVAVVTAGLIVTLKDKKDEKTVEGTVGNHSKIASLQTLSIDLLNSTLAEIRLYREKSSPPNENYFFTAEYLFQEAIEYVTGAWEMVKSGKSNASIALSRWVLEASLNLIWTVAEKGKIEERHKLLIGEALRNEACLLEGLAKLRPDKSHQFESKADEARKIRKDLNVEEPKSLEQRIEEIRKSDKANWPELYPLYRICCAAAHPSFKVWERFGVVANSIVSKDPVDKQSTACLIAANSTFYLVISIYHLVGLGDPKQLKDWWENKVRPLL